MAEVADLFTSLETKREDLVETRRIERKGERLGPHLIKLPKGAVAEYIKLTPYQQFCWRVMGRAVTMKYRLKENQILEENLLKAHMKVRPEEFVATIWMTTLIMAVVSVAAGSFLGWFLTLLMPAAMALLIAPVIIIIIPVATYFVMMGGPASRAKARGREIDKKISATMSFISAMASANVNIDVIFKELSRQTQYGEIADEAEWITRDTELLGVDIITALKDAAKRTPSQRFQDFLQGVVTTSQSGGELKPYFLMKHEQFEKDFKLQMKGTMETLGMLAESFVTVGVAFPLFLVVILSIMAIISAASQFIVLMLYVVCAGMIPGVQFGFIVALSAVGGSEE